MLRFPKHTNSFVLPTILAGMAFGIYTAGAQVINEDVKITALDGASSDQFGYSIATADGLVVVGTIADADNGFNSGAAYLFDASTGTQIFKLLPNDGEFLQQFGYSVAIDNGIIAVGAVFDNDGGSMAGSVYLFDAATGAQLTELRPNDIAPDDQFGFAVAMDNGLLVAVSNGDDDNGSMSGSAYVFDVATGNQLAKLLANDGASFDRFGHWIDIDNGVVAIGSRDDDDNGTDSGSAYLFDAATGTQLLKIVPSDGETEDEFGYSIAISNGVVAVGSRNDDDVAINAGAVYLFDITDGTQLLKLTASDGNASDQFGNRVGMDSGHLVVGAPIGDDNGLESGVAYLYEVSSGLLLNKLVSSDAASGDQFGISAAIGSGYIAIGAYNDDDNGFNSGSAYMFADPASSCPADLTGDGLLNFFDVSAFLNAFSAGDPVADFTGDGLYNFFDVSAFLSAFTAGCP